MMKNTKVTEIWDALHFNKQAMKPTSACQIVV